MHGDDDTTFGTHLLDAPVLRPSSPQVSARMSVLARRHTRPEVELRRRLFRRGLRYRVQYKVPGRNRRTIDVAFPRARVAIFVDGCFWHGCAEHGVQPTANEQWWREKFARNRARDADTTEYLEGLGWTVLRFWEHEAPDDVANAVERVVRA